MVTSRVAGVIDSDDKTISLYVSNTGEFSSYSFIIDSDQDFQEGDEIWVKFPQEYDEFLGKAYIKYAWGAPSTYYLDCKSE